MVFGFNGNGRGFFIANAVFRANRRFLPGQRLQVCYRNACAARALAVLEC